MSFLDSLKKGLKSGIDSILTSAASTGKQILDNTINSAVGAVQNGIQDAFESISTGYGNWVGEGNNNASTNVSATPTGTTPPVQTPAPTTPAPEQTTPSVQTPAPTTPAPEQTTPSVQTPAPTTPAPEQTTPQVQTPAPEQVTTPPSTTTPIEVDTGFDSYEDFINNTVTNAGNVYNASISTIDKVNTDTLAALDQQLNKGNAAAQDIYDTTVKGLEDQKQSVYNYADEYLAGALGNNQEAYDKIVVMITEQMEAGKITAQEAKELIIYAADEAKKLTYASAERNRQEAETMADVARQRAIADANSAYEQNKASYGANAEIMGSMGLSGGGYSDWLDSAAYAQNRAETQAARAQSDKTKREAKYTEDQAKLAADKQHLETSTQAELDYLNRMDEIDTTYRTNMTEAEQKKLAADREAEETAAGLKMQADTDYTAGKTSADVTYRGQLYENEKEHGKEVLEANNAADAARLEAGKEYIEAITASESELAKYKEALKAGDQEAQKIQLSMYEQILSGVSNGTYTKEVAEGLADAFGFSDEWKNAISTAGDTYNTEKANAKAEQDQANKVANFADLLGRVNKGELTKDEVLQIAKDLGFDETKDSAQLTLLGAAADRFATGTEEDKKLGKTNSFIALLDSANSGTYNADQIQELATQLGFDANNPDDKRLIDMLVKGANAFADEKAAAELKADTEYMNGLYVELMTAANSGDLTEEQIRDIAGRFGFKGDDLYNLTKAAKDVATKKAVEELEMEKGLSAENKSTILKEMANGDLGTDITDADIDKWVKEEILTPEDAEDLKVKRNEMIIEELEYYAQNGYTTEAVDKVEELVEKGIISKDDDVYQKTYFDVGLYDAQNLVNTGSATAADITKYEKTLKKQLEEGKLSEADYNSLMDYLYKSAGKVVNKNSYTFKRSNSAESSGPFEYLDVTINGKEYKGVWVFSEKKADETLSNVLDKMANNGEMLVMFNGELYAKTYIYGWCPVNNEDLKKDYSTIAESTPKTTKPKHKVVKSTPTKNETDDDGIRGESKGGGGGTSNNVLTNSWK